MLKSIWNTFLDHIFPPRCVCCGRVSLPGQQLCTACDGTLPPAFWSGRMTQEETGKTFLCIAPDVYDGNIRKAILRFKFYGKQKSAPFFAERMFQQICRDSLRKEFDCIASVPLSKERLKARGYNQSQLVAEELCRMTGVPYADVLEKVTDNREQHKLHRADRQQNVLGVYAVRQNQIVQGKRFLLLDDIMTTGATLQECVGQLYAAGAEQVICAVAARVPLEELSC